MNNKIIVIIAIIIIAAITGCINKAESAKQNVEDKKIVQEKKEGTKEDILTGIVKVSGYEGAGGVTYTNPPWIAQELGYLGGIKIEEANLRVGAESLTALSTGQIDAAHVPFTAGIRAISKGAKIKAVALAHGSQTSNYDLLTLDDSPIKSAKDLKGKKVGGIKPGGSGTEYFGIIKYLESGNLTLKDIEAVNVPQGQEEQILRSKQIDAVIIFGDYQLGSIKDRGGVRVLFTQADILPKGTYHCGLFVSENFLKKPEFSKFLDAFVKTANWERENPDKAKELLIKYAKDRGVIDVEQRLKYFRPTDIRENALIKDSDVQWFLDRFIEYGELKEGQLKLSDIYTNEYNKN